MISKVLCRFPYYAIFIADGLKILWYELNALTMVFSDSGCLCCCQLFLEAKLNVWHRFQLIKYTFVNLRYERKYKNINILIYTKVAIYA